MRTVTAAEALTLAALNRVVTRRVKVGNGSGTMVDMSSWVEHVSIDHDADQPVSGATISFTRASGLVQSLSPFRTDSTLNRLDDGVTYGPLADLTRPVTVEFATTAIGASIVSGDWKLWLDGTINIIDFDHSPLVGTCRDKGGAIVDRWVETPKAYGSGPGVAVETVMQSILDDNFGGGVVSLYTPVSPSYLISPAYQQQVQSIMEAMVALAQNPGFDIRYKWDDGTAAFRFTLLNPPRSKTTPDYTLPPNAYYDITALSLDLTDIRNVIIVSYADSGNQGNRATLTVSDSASITKYGRRVFIITEADTSPINTSAEATTLANSALADLKDPKATMELEMPFFWPIELGDLWRISDNRVTHNTNQDLAVVQFTHNVSAGHHRTRVKLRGSPIGQYLTWLGRGGTIGGTPGNGTAKPPVPFIVPLNTEADDATWDLQFYAVWGAGGGGTNLTYTITLKKSFGSTTTLNSGNASSFPKNLTVTRDPKYDGVLSFTVTDAATGMSRVATWSIPSVAAFINSTGDTFTVGMRGSSDFATKNAGATTSFGVNRHNDQQTGLHTDSKTFGVSFDNIPQIRALPQSWLIPGASSTVDRVIEMKGINVTVAGYDIRAVSSTGSSSSPQTETWATTLNGTPAATQTIANNNAAVFCDLSNANATLTTYTALFDVDTTAMLGSNTLYVNLYKNNGTGSTSWTLVDSRSFGSGVSSSGFTLGFSGAMALDWDLRIVITYQNAPAVGQKASVVVHNVTYSKINPGTETSITSAAGNGIMFQAMEAP